MATRAFASTAPLTDDTRQFFCTVGMPKVPSLLIEWTELHRAVYTLASLGMARCNGLDTARCVVAQVGDDYAFCVEAAPSEAVWAIDRASSARQFVNRSPQIFACCLSFYVKFVRDFDVNGPAAIAEAVDGLERQMRHFDTELDELSWWHPVLEEMRLGIW